MKSGVCAMLVDNEFRSTRYDYLIYRVGRVAPFVGHPPPLGELVARFNAFCDRGEFCLRLQVLLDDPLTFRLHGHRDFSDVACERLVQFFREQAQFMGLHPDCLEYRIFGGSVYFRTDEEGLRCR